MSSEPWISVVVPCKRLTERARTYVDRLRNQTYRNFDVYVVTDDPESIAGGAGFDVTNLASGPVMPNQKRLQAALASDADIIALLDDDASAAPDWLATAARHFADPHVVAAGGPGTTPHDDGPSQRASGAIYASVLVSLREVRRYVPRPLRDVAFLPSCNLLVRRGPFIAAVTDSLAFWGGEDLLLCVRLTQTGKRIVYDPAALVHHHRRALFWAHFTQVWNYAIHRGFFLKRFPEASTDPAYCIPALFVAGHIALLCAPLLPRPVQRTLLGLVCGYAALVAAEALRVSGKHRAAPVSVAVGIYLTHLTYGAGMLSGLSRAELDH